MCTYADHDALRADPARMRHDTSPQGVQLDGDGVVLFEWRGCPTCGTSLALAVEEGVPIHIEE